MTDAQAVPPLISTVDDGVVVVEPEGPPSEKLPPSQWARKRLFSTPLNSLITLVFGGLALFLGYRFFRFIFLTGRWEPVEQNLELFMIGTFSRDERWRVVGQALLMAAGLGLFLGNLGSARRDAAQQTGEPLVKVGWRTYVGSYWSIALFVAVLLGAFSRTPGPWMLAGGMLVLGVAGWLLTSRFPAAVRSLGWTFAALCVVASFQLLSGTFGWAWFYTTLAFVPFVTDMVGRIGPAVARWFSPLVIGLAGLIAVGTLLTQSTTIGIAVVLVALYGAIQLLQGDRLDAARTGAVVVVGAIVVVASRAIGHEGTDWGKWSGFHLSLVVAACAILLAFPIGVLLALGRRSSLPAVRVMSVTYIEFFRGAPLITFLLAGQFFLGFFLNTDSPLSNITRAIAAITLFSAAYVAEIVRGGLQAVPKGQVEAGQASGLSAAKITRLIVMPQALRAVIPAMVGQFISLFKDTSLLGIIAISEFLDVRALVHSQESFRGFGIAETATFVAFGYWAFSFAMSRESQRLERRLAVGQR